MEDVAELWMHALLILPFALVFGGAVLAVYHRVTVDPLRDRVAALERGVQPDGVSPGVVYRRRGLLNLSRQAAPFVAQTRTDSAGVERAASGVKVEIRVTPDGQELWIDNRWCVAHPRLLDGNVVAHNIALGATRAGFPMSYKLVPPWDEGPAKTSAGE